jgi:hypothetical protein
LHVTGGMPVQVALPPCKSERWPLTARFGPRPTWASKPRPSVPVVLPSDRSIENTRNPAARVCDCCWIRAPTAPHRSRCQTDCRSCGARPSSRVGAMADGRGYHAGSKRPPADPDVPVFERLELTPLGGGNEVGRSCLVLRYKGKVVMMDCGILPSFQGLESLPWLGELDPAEVDVVFITHFHLDHAAALPHFTERLSGACPCGGAVGAGNGSGGGREGTPHSDVALAAQPPRSADPTRPSTPPPRRLPRAHLCDARHHRVHEAHALRLHPRHQHLVGRPQPGTCVPRGAAGERAPRRYHSPRRSSLARNRSLLHTAFLFIAALQRGGHRPVHRAHGGDRLQAARQRGRCVAHNNAAKRPARLAHFAAALYSLRLHTPAHSHALHRPLPLPLRSSRLRYCAGLQFMFFNAGHVLGAAMVLLEIAGVRVLYTGDYSCEDDRHLMAAEVPRQFPPDVLIVEATYGMQVRRRSQSQTGRERAGRRACGFVGLPRGLNSTPPRVFYLPCADAPRRPPAGARVARGARAPLHRVGGAGGAPWRPLPDPRVCAGPRAGAAAHPGRVLGGAPGAAALPHLLLVQARVAVTGGVPHVH